MIHINRWYETNVSGDENRVVTSIIAKNSASTTVLSLRGANNLCKIQSHHITAFFVNWNWTFTYNTSHFCQNAYNGRFMKSSFNWVECCMASTSSLAMAQASKGFKIKRFRSTSCSMQRDSILKQRKKDIKLSKKLVQILLVIKMLSVKTFGKKKS